MNHYQIDNDNILKLVRGEPAEILIVGKNMKLLGRRWLING